MWLLSLSAFAVQSSLRSLLRTHWPLVTGHCCVVCVCACAAWHCREIPQYDLFGLRPVCPISSIHTKHDIVMRQQLSSCFLYL